MDVCPGKAELHDSVSWVSQHMVGRAQGEAGRGTLQDQWWHWQDSCPCRDIQTTVNAFVNPLLSLLPSSLPALPCRLHLLRCLPKPWLRSTTAMASPPLAHPQLPSYPCPAPATHCKQAHPPQQSLVFSWVLGRSSWHWLALTPWRLSALLWGPADWPWAGLVWHSQMWV